MRNLAAGMEGDWGKRLVIEMMPYLKIHFFIFLLEMTTKYVICFRASGRLSRLKQGLAPTAVEGALDKLPDSGFDLASTIQVRFKSC